MQNERMNEKKKNKTIKKERIKRLLLKRNGAHRVNVLLVSIY